MNRSLRWRMQVWHALILVAVLAVFGSAVYYLQWQSRLQEFDLRLEQTGIQVLSRLSRLMFPGGGRGFRRRGDRNNERRQPPPAPPDQASSPELRDTIRPTEIIPARLSGSKEVVQGVKLLSMRQQREVPEAPLPPPPDRRDRERGPGDPRPGGGPPQGPNLPGPPPIRVPLIGKKLVVDDNDLEQLGFPEELAMLFDPESNSPEYFAVWDYRGNLTLKTTTAPDTIVFPESPPSGDTMWIRDFATRDGNREIRMITRFGVKLVLGESLSAALNAQHATGLGLLLVGGGVLAVGLVGGTWISNRAISPIKQMTRTAEAISASNLSERINVSETDSELGSLATVLNETFTRLEEAFEQQSRFTADASHELRTPVSVLLSQTELTLSRDRSPQEYQEALETCRRTAMRMRSLVEGLLFLARIDAGEKRLEADRFDLGALVEETVDDLMPLAEDRQLAVSKEIAPISIRSNRPRVQQVLTNLLTNAIRYNRPDGTIRVRLTAADSHAVLSVEDSGVGIGPEDLPHVFERFYRVDKARTLAEGGTGLGLAICKTIVEALQGAIEIDSRPGVGTTVTVRLPLDRT